MVVRCWGTPRATMRSPRILFVISRPSVQVRASAPAKISKLRDVGCGFRETRSFADPLRALRSSCAPGSPRPAEACVSRRLLPPATQSPRPPGCARCAALLWRPAPRRQQARSGRNPSWGGMASERPGHPTPTLCLIARFRSPVIPTSERNRHLRFPHPQSIERCRQEIGFR
jgi:hypothetical protein